MTGEQKKALQHIPRKNREVEEQMLPGGNMILTYQVVYRPLFLKVKKLLRSGRADTFTKKLQLDELGVHVWSLMDGTRNVDTIIDEFARAHCLNRREAQVSVTLFLKSLGERGLIGMGEPGHHR